MNKIIIAAIALIATSASAQQSDPYAKIETEQRLTDYYARRTVVMNDVRFVFFAKGCGVLWGSGAESIRNFLLRPLWEDTSSGLWLIPGNEVTRVDSLGHVAEQEGIARSKDPGACDWFKDNPNAVTSLRDMQRRGVH